MLQSNAGGGEAGRAQFIPVVLGRRRLQALTLGLQSL